MVQDERGRKNFGYVRVLGILGWATLRAGVYSISLPFQNRRGPVYLNNISRYDDYKSYYAVAARWKTTDDKIGVLLKKPLKLYIYTYLLFIHL